MQTETTTASRSSNGSPSSFTVKLAGEPLENVTLKVESADPEEVIVGSGGASTLTFTREDWDVPKVVTLTAGGTGEDTGETTRMTVSVDAGASADEYDNVSKQTIDVTTIYVDDKAVAEDPGEPGIVLAGT